MKKLSHVILLTISGLILAQCSDDDNDLSRMTCGNPFEINDTTFKNRTFTDSLLRIDSLSILDDCLSFNVGFSGCDDTHTFILVTDGALAESAPPQMHFRLVDEKPESCQAAFTKVIEYDMTEMDDLSGTETSVRLIFGDQGKEVLWER